MGEDTLFHAREEDEGKLEALGRVQRHQGHARRVLVEGVHVGHERHGIQEGLEGDRARLQAGRQRLDSLPGGDELLRGGHELLDVLEPRLGLGRPLRLEHVAIAGRGRDLVDQGGHGQGSPPLAQLGDKLAEVLEGPPRLGRQVGRRRRAGLQQREAARPGALGQPVEGGLADPTARRRHRASEGDIVQGVDHETQIGQEVLDLASLVEAHATHDEVRNARPAEGVFQDAGLGIGSVEHRHVSIVGPGRVLSADGLGDPARLLVLVPGAIDLGPVALGVLRPQALVPARGIVGDDPGGDVQDALGRAVVLLEGDDQAIREVLLEVENVPEIRPPPPIDRLIRIADHAEVPVLLGQELDDAVLRPVGVLILVHEHVFDFARDRIA